MLNYQSLVITRVSEDNLMLDESTKIIGALDDKSLVKRFELDSPDNHGLRSSLTVGSYLFTGHENGTLQRIDLDKMEIEYIVSLHAHIFSMEQLDREHIVCGQMNGWIDVVQIETGDIVCSKQLQHITGNITILKKTDRENEIMLGTSRGVYFAFIGVGLGLMEVEIERFDKNQSKLTPQDSMRPFVRVPKGSEHVEYTTHGAPMQDLEGFSAITGHKDDELISVKSGTQPSVYKKPFTMKSQKDGSEEQ